jgi:hypothetical protein
LLEIRYPQRGWNLAGGEGHFKGRRLKITRICRSLPEIPLKAPVLVSARLRPLGSLSQPTPTTAANSLRFSPFHSVLLLRASVVVGGTARNRDSGGLGFVVGAQRVRESEIARISLNTGSPMRGLSRRFRHRRDSCS